jgi:hypothetical protein
MEPDADPVALLRRWEDAGGLWRVLARDAGTITVGLYRCDGGEEVDRIVTGEPPLTQFLDGRSSSEEDRPPAAGTPTTSRPEEAG